MSCLPRGAFAALCLCTFFLATSCTTSDPESDSPAASQDVYSGVGPRGSTPAAGAELDCPVLVVGGGTGGMAAAIAAARVGVKTCVTEETDWVGGQLTAQGLNASDDSRFTDTIGSTRTYRRLRQNMRAAYGGKSNPGNCWVSHLCAEPKVALDALASMTKAAIDAGTLTIFYNLKTTSVDVANRRVRGVVLTRPDGGTVTIHAKQTIDATELGDVIKLSGTAYRLGQEPKSDTGEPEAPANGCSGCVQSLTYDIVLERRPANENHVIPKPDGYGVKPWMTGFSHGVSRCSAAAASGSTGASWTAHHSAVVAPTSRS